VLQYNQLVKVVKVRIKMLSKKFSDPCMNCRGDGVWEIDIQSAKITLCNECRRELSCLAGDPFETGKTLKGMGLD
jgi:hypothetical protein